MSDTSASDREEPVVLESLPDRGVSMDIVDGLNDGDVLDLAGPLVIDTATDRVTHLNLVVGDTHHFVGWNPTTEQWEQIVVVVETPDEDETLDLKRAIRVVDDTGEPVLAFDETTSPELEDVVAFVRAYVEHTYPETDRLYNVMNEAMEEVEREID